MLQKVHPAIVFQELFPECIRYHDALIQNSRITLDLGWVLENREWVGGEEILSEKSPRYLLLHAQKCLSQLLLILGDSYCKLTRMDELL